MGRGHMEVGVLSDAAGERGPWEPRVERVCLSGGDPKRAKTKGGNTNSSRPIIGVVIRTVFFVVKSIQGVRREGCEA